MAKRRAGKGARKKRAVLKILGVILVLVCGFITVAPQLQMDTKKMYPEKTSVLPRFFAVCRAVFSS